LSTTPDCANPAQVFRVTHPYHPLSGREFRLLRRGRSWGDHRVWFHNDAGQLISLPETWTSLGPTDPFVTLARGRACGRVADLLTLAQMVNELSGRAVKGTL
jgi:hypothetical protein